MKFLKNVGKAIAWLVVLSGGFFFSCVYLSLTGFNAHRVDDKRQRRKAREVAQKQEILKIKQSEQTQVTKQISISTYV
jgi:hypothetical protein